MTVSADCHNAVSPVNYDVNANVIAGCYSSSETNSRALGIFEDDDLGPLYAGPRIGSRKQVVARISSICQ